MQDTHLAVRHRRTLLDADRVRIALTVFCPVRGDSVPIARCRECGHSDGIVHRSSEEGAPSTLKCRAPVGSVHYDDLPDLLAAELTPVFNLMTPDVICVEPDTCAELTLRWLLDAGLPGAAVVDAAGRLVAYVSKDDLCRALLDEVLEPSPDDAPTLAESGIESGQGFRVERPRASVRQLLTPRVCAIPETASVGRAAAYMACRRAQQLVVVSGNREVVGLLMARDVVGWLARECGYNVRPVRSLAGA